MNIHVQQGRILFERKMFKQAEKELRLGLADNPQDGYAHSLLGLSLSAQKKYSEALEEARLGVRIATSVAYGHYALAVILRITRKLNDSPYAARWIGCS